MKKITRILTMMAIAALPLAFTSCDDDDYWYDGPWYGNVEPWWYGYDDGGWGYDDNGGNNPGGDQGNTLVDEAQVLNGEWDGQMIYTNGDNGKTDRFYANMTFVQNSTNAIKGTGTEYDYYLNSDGSEGENQTLKFTWYIDNNGDIYVKYASGSTFVMDFSASHHGFYLDEATGVFKGFMIGTNNNDMIQFDFTRKTSNAKAVCGKTTVSPSTTTFGYKGIAGITSTTKISLPKAR